MPFQKLIDEKFDSFLINSVLISLGSKDNVNPLTLFIRE